LPHLRVVHAHALTAVTRRVVQGLRLTRLVCIQRLIHRVNCARLRPVIFTSERRTIPFQRGRAIEPSKAEEVPSTGIGGKRFGPTLAAEHLEAEDGLSVDAETLRRWMLEEGLWSPARRSRPPRKRRERKAHFGELVQLDGSFHEWLEGRGPRGCLMNLVDDATGTVLCRLGEQETIWAVVNVLAAWIGEYGIPMALYTDWKNVYNDSQPRKSCFEEKSR
jgi:hypothetical protein